MLVCEFFEVVVRALIGLCVHIGSEVMKYFNSLVRSCFFRSLREDGDRMCYAVVKAVAFCHAALSHVGDVDQLPDVRNIQAWAELSEKDVVISDGGVFFLRTALVPYQRTFADFAAIGQCVDECLGVSGWFVGVKI